MVTATLQALVALTAALLLALRTRLAANRRACYFKEMMLGLACLSGLLYYNPVVSGQTPFVHLWEFFHYYLGSKYFPELGYEGLYRCVSIADAENGHLDEVRTRVITDLGNLEMESAAKALINPSLCKAAFTPSRWDAFRHDVDFFRNRGPYRGPSGGWAEAQRDFGYNGTPAWTILATVLANTGPASDTQILALALVDIALLLLLWISIYRSFGWLGFTTAFIYWASNKPAEFTWNGGAFLREDWLTLVVLGICWLKRGRTGLAGSAFALATGLRGYPIVIPIVLAIQEVTRLASARSWCFTREARRFMGCMVVTTLVVVIISTAVCGHSWKIWPEFLHNSIRYLSTPMLNRIGLRALGDVPYATLFTALLSGILVFVASGLSRWQAAIVSLGLLPLLFSINCYYYTVFLLFGLLPPAEIPWVGMALLYLAGISQAIPILFAGEWVYGWTSLFVLSFVLLVVVTTWPRRRSTTIASRAGYTSHVEPDVSRT